MGGHGAMYLSANIQNSLALQVWWVADMEVWSHPIKERIVNGTRFRSEGKSQVYASYVLGMVTKMKTNKLALIIDCGVDDF
jgi:hypothetical protein